MKYLPLLVSLFLTHLLFSHQVTNTNSTPPSNPIVLENLKPGTDQWQLTNPAIAREIEGYMSKTSIQQGDSIALFVNTGSSSYDFSIYRMGWYEGLGGRLIDTYTAIKGYQQVIPTPDEKTGLVECNWDFPNYIKTDATWTSGVYLVKLEEVNTHTQSYTIFVVRDDLTPSDVLFSLPVTTYQAYNYWGGKSLYSWGCGEKLPWGSTAGHAASRVSFHRPYAKSNNPVAAIGMGAGEFFTNMQPVQNGYPISSAAWNYNMVRWLEMEGYDVNYSTNIDTHSSGDAIVNHKVFLSQGHDEYWSREMVDHLDSASKQGVNLAFLGANNIYWQVRFEPSTLNGDPNTIMVCYKSDISDPIKDAKTTIKFREAPVNLPEARLLGVQFKNEPVDKSIVISNEKHRYFKNTGLKNGDELKGLLGYEVDGVTQDSPKNIEVLTTSLALKEPSEHMPMSYKVKEFFIEFNFAYLIALSILSLILLLLLLKAIGKTRANGFKRFLKVSLIVITLLGNSILYVMRHEFTAEFTSNMTVYTRSLPMSNDNSSKVFSTGTIQWSWGLDDFGAPSLRTSRLDQRVQTITKNVLEELIQE